MATRVTCDTELKVLNHDRSRGKWASSWDFLFACIGHAFRVDAVLVLPSMMFEELGLYGISLYFILLGICVVPVVFVQSFLGQFSSAGFISVFRISPLFKGIGYIGLLVNLIVLTYLSLYGALPLLHLLHTLRPTLPWSCEGSKEWMELMDDNVSLCSKNITIEWAAIMQIPSVDFFRVHLKHHPGYRIWLTLCSFIVWIVVGVVIIQPIEKIGKFLRYSSSIVLVIMSVCVVRLAFLPGAFAWVMDTLIDANEVGRWRDSWTLMPLILVSALGPGWGNILTMASFNKFKADAMKSSWHLCLAKFGVTCVLSLMGLFVMDFLRNIDPFRIVFQYKDSQWKEFLFTPTVLSFFELPRFWTWIFFTMILLGALNLLSVQLLSVLTSVFDEFDSLRRKKRKVTLSFVGALAVCSIPFCSHSGFITSQLVSAYLIFTQLLLNLLLVVVALWVCRRERLQRDIAFMTDGVCATWKVLTSRVVTPTFFLLALYAAYKLCMVLGLNDPTVMLIAGSITLTCWLGIPGYCVFNMGRVGQSFQPVDWYPADPGDRQNYDEHQHGTPNALTTMTAAPAE